MTKLQIALVLACVYAVSQSTPIGSSEEKSALVQEQAKHDYNQHQETLQTRDSSSSSLSPKYEANGFTFDNQDETHRDRGYGFEKAYAYSRETAFFDFDDNKGTLNARDLVEKYGKEDDLFKNVPK